jgi:predicted phosphodiesterase
MPVNWTAEKIEEARDAIIKQGSYSRASVYLALNWGEDVTPEAIRKALYRNGDSLKKLNGSGGNSTQEIVFGAMACLHAGSNQSAADQALDFVHKADSAGAENILIAGDILDGCYHRGHQYELTHVGFEKQAQRAIEILPQIKGLTYHTISGNHDMNSYFKSAGLDPIGELQARAEALGRHDIKHLGAYQGRLLFPGGLRVEMIHPKGMASYNRYKHALGMANSPHITIVGHFHRYRVEDEMDTVLVMPGCFQWQTTFLRQNEMVPSVGGVIIRMLRHDDWWCFDHKWIKYRPKAKPWKSV